MILITDINQEERDVRFAFFTYGYWDRENKKQDSHDSRGVQPWRTER
jgi:hypothetical protein